MKINLKPGDVLVFEDQAKGLYGKIKKWLLGTTSGHTWGHTSIYVGDNEQIESIGRGVCQTKIIPGRFCAVLRYYTYNEAVGNLLIESARKLRDNGGSWYDYYCIPRFVIPQLIFYKIFKLKFGFGWHRNSHFICSEATEEIYYNAGFPLWDNIGVPPLPDDFFYTDSLKMICFTDFTDS